MTDLIARLEAASGPDCALDADIALTQGWSEFPGDNWIGPNAEICVPAFTSSIDAALTLAPEGANAYGFEVDPALGVDAFFSRNNVASGHWFVSANGAPTPALAICIAALKAREATKEKPHGD